jgi:glutamine cyclotransferase
VPVLRARVLARHPHDTSAFTEGLVFWNGALLESTGLRGQSSLRQVDLATGVVTRRVDVPAPYFGEGLALAGQRLVMLTWQESEAHVYDVDTFARTGQFAYAGEGWGLCHDGQRLVMSDGTDVLTFRDPNTFAATGTVAVRRAGTPVRRLNELECVGDSVYANVWMTDSVVQIDPASGRVRAVIDASGLLTAAEARAADVLNGIAHDPATGRFFLTGKNWPWLFEVEFVPAN